MENAELPHNKARHNCAASCAGLATLRFAFLLLVLTQTLHSFEGYFFSLWAVLAPARFIRGLVSDDLAFGFTIINSVIVVFCYWTYLVPVSRNWTSASLFLWGWCLVELGNGIAQACTPRPSWCFCLATS